MLVRDWMTKEPVTVDPRTPVLAARRHMHDRGIRHLPVVDSGLLVGIVTDREVQPAPPSRRTSLAAHQIISSLLDNMPVAAVMRQDVIVTTPSEPITSAARLLLRERLGTLPVIAGGALVGILSHSDVLKALMTVAEAGVVGRADHPPRPDHSGPLLLNPIGHWAGTKHYFCQ
jgi:acetoin utilization protein AcuB